MNPNYSRRLLWHGTMLFLLGLLTGIIIPLLKSPRLGVSSHLEGVMNGTFLLVLGLAWPHLRLSSRAQTTSFWLFLYSTYANWGAILLSAMWGAGYMSTVATPGLRAAVWQEVIVAVILVSLSITIITACGILLWGLRGREDVAQKES